MASDEDPIHTIEDDITYEKMKHMPKRTAFYTAHRKLSWQYDKDVKQVERDQKLATVGLERAHNSMVDRLVKLQETKKQLGIRKTSAEHEVIICRRQSDSVMVTHHHRPKSEERLAETKTELEAGDEAEENSPRKYHRIRRNTIAEGVTDTRFSPIGRRLTVADIHNSHSK